MVLRLCSFYAVITSCDCALFLLESVWLGVCVMSCRALTGSDVLAQLLMQLLALFMVCEFCRKRLHRHRLLSPRLLQLIWWSELLMYLVSCLYGWTWVLERAPHQVCAHLSDCWVSGPGVATFLHAVSWLTCLSTAAVLPALLGVFGDRARWLTAGEVEDARVLMCELVAAVLAILVLVGVMVFQQLGFDQSNLPLPRLTILPLIGCITGAADIMLSSSLPLLPLHTS